MQFQKITASALAAVLVMAGAGVVPAAAQKNLCSDLKRVIKAAEQGFKPLRGKVLVGGLTYRPRLNLPGMAQCFILDDNNTILDTSYFCKTQQMSGQPEAESRRVELEQDVIACFPNGKVSRGVGTGEHRAGLPFTKIDLGTTEITIALQNPGGGFETLFDVK